MRGSFGGRSAATPCRHEAVGSWNSALRIDRISLVRGITPIINNSLLKRQGRRAVPMHREPAQRANPATDRESIWATGITRRAPFSTEGRAQSRSAGRAGGADLHKELVWSAWPLGSRSTVNHARQEFLARAQHTYFTLYDFPTIFLQFSARCGFICGNRVMELVIRAVSCRSEKQ